MYSIYPCDPYASYDDKPIHCMFFSWPFIHSLEALLFSLPAGELCRLDCFYLQHVEVHTTFRFWRLPSNSDRGVIYTALEFVDDRRIYKENFIGLLQ